MTKPIPYTIQDPKTGKYYKVDLRAMALEAMKDTESQARKYRLGHGVLSALSGLGGAGVASLIIKKAPGPWRMAALAPATLGAIGAWKQGRQAVEASHLLSQIRKAENDISSKSIQEFINTPTAGGQVISFIAQALEDAAAARAKTAAEQPKKEQTLGQVINSEQRKSRVKQLAGMMGTIAAPVGGYYAADWLGKGHPYLGAAALAAGSIGGAKSYLSSSEHGERARKIKAIKQALNAEYPDWRKQTA